MGNDKMIREELEYTTEVILIRKKKDTLHKGGEKKDKRTNNDLQNTTQKTKDRATRTCKGLTQFLLLIESTS